MYDVVFVKTVMSVAEYTGNKRYTLVQRTFTRCHVLLYTAYISGAKLFAITSSVVNGIWKFFHC